MIKQKIDDINLDFLEEILKKIKSDEIENEFNLLLKILKIKENKNNNIIEKMNLLKNKNKNVEKVNKIILLLNDFNLKEKEIKLELEKAKNRLKAKPVTPKISGNRKEFK